MGKSRTRWTDLVVIVVVIALAALIWSRTSAPPSDEPADVLLYLPFDGDIRDHSGHQLSTAGVAGGPGFSPGVQGQAADFDGSGSSVTVPDLGTLPIGDELTLEFWVRMADWQNPYQGSPALESVASLSTSFTVALGSKSHIPQATMTAGSEESVSVSGGEVEPGKWYRLDLVYRGPTGAVTLYVDGRPVAENALSGPVRVNPGVPFVVGTWFKQNQAFCGQVDELRVYSRALSAEEIGSRTGRPSK